MQALERMVRDAAALADPASGGAPPTPEGEVARVMQVCNACRYCEGFCAVFPAMTRRLAFAPADAHFLANLCHSCGACLHACQYAPPHDFRINVPQAMARVRGRTYRTHAWPRALGVLYERNGLALAGALAAALALFVALAVARHAPLWGAVPGADFYRLLPHETMVALFAPVFGFALLALGIGVVRFWREAAPGPVVAAALADATHAALTLRYLDGGHGDGCPVEDDRATQARRHAHHATFYGFALCFAATSVATLYHYVGDRPAPYAYDSLPKLLGVAGGVLLAAGTAALWRLRRRRHPLHGDAAQAPMDRAFIALLFATAVTGLALTALRATAALPPLLALHLGAVLALFATLPYGKFAHAPYRAAALLKWAVERRRPSGLALGGD